jgi:hypothetical protein
MTLWIFPKRLLLVLTLLVSSLALVNVSIQFSSYILGYGDLLRYARLLTFEGSAKIPKWLASSNLLICALLLATIACAKTRQGDRFSRHWVGLSFIFCAISLEEAVGFHELATVPLRSALHATGFLYHSWTIVGLIFTPILALIYCNFFFHLPLKTRQLFLLAATLYVGGALGMEILRGPYNAVYGDQNMLAAMLKMLEELFQMFGIVAFIYALLSYLSIYIKEVHLYIKDATPEI